MEKMVKGESLPLLFEMKCHQDQLLDLTKGHGLAKAPE